MSQARIHQLILLLIGHSSDSLAWDDEAYWRHSLLLLQLSGQAVNFSQDYAEDIISLSSLRMTTHL